MVQKCSKGGYSLIVWAECYLSFLEMKMIENCSAVKKVVFVSKQEYDNYIDECIIQKSTYIYNLYGKFDARKRISCFGKIMEKSCKSDT